MVCTVEVTEKPKLDSSILIEGLPGIGFVANVAVLHLIRELGAVRFARIHSSAFQDLTVTTEAGGTCSPINELYYHKTPAGKHDLIFWYGNTQALTTFGQYELCGKVLDIAYDLGCRSVITLGGYKTDEARPVPQIYAAASDAESLQEALRLGAKVMVGQIFGVAGLTIALAKLQGFKGFSLLTETPSTYPDVNAARQVLTVLSKHLELTVGFTNLAVVVDETKKMLESFGMLRNIREEKKKEEQPFRWFI